MRYSNPNLLGVFPKGPLDNWPDDEAEFIQEMERV